MFLENTVTDAVDPQTLGRFWEAALGCATLTDEHAGFETRLTVDDFDLDLCFQRVPDRALGPQRLHFDVRGGAEQAEVVERMLGLGATHLDIGQGDVPWVVLADPAGNAFCVLEDRPEYAATGPLAALVLQVADPARERDFWGWLSGWEPVEDARLASLRHPSGRGPLLELVPEPEPKGPGKNRIHLDIRLEPGDEVDELAREITERGGREMHFGWGELPYRHFVDPSGNEFCLLPAPAAA